VFVRATSVAAALAVCALSAAPADAQVRRRYECPDAVNVLRANAPSPFQTARNQPMIPFSGYAVRRGSKLVEPVDGAWDIRRDTNFWLVCTYGEGIVIEAQLRGIYDTCEAFEQRIECE